LKKYKRKTVKRIEFSRHTRILEQYPKRELYMTIEAFWKNLMTTLMNVKAPFTVIWFLRKLLNSDDVVLDLGCGPNSRIAGFKLKYLVGVDLFKPYIEAAKNSKTHDDLVLADVKFLPFKEKAFDIVLALDLVEYLKKEDSIKLIFNMEKLAKRLVTITTPNGFTSGKVVNGNILQLHMCGYTIRELKQFEYKRGQGTWILST
jgi:SAM-dependent methyltransferase